MASTTRLCENLDVGWHAPTSCKSINWTKKNWIVKLPLLNSLSGLQYFYIQAMFFRNKIVILFKSKLTESSIAIVSMALSLSGRTQILLSTKKPVVLFEVRCTFERAISSNSGQVTTKFTHQCFFGSLAVQAQVAFSLAHRKKCHCR